jgi:hypothetical protein
MVRGGVQEEASFTFWEVGLQVGPRDGWIPHRFRPAADNLYSVGLMPAINTRNAIDLADVVRRGALPELGLVGNASHDIVSDSPV